MANVLKQQYSGNKTPDWAREKIDAAMQSRSRLLNLDSHHDSHYIADKLTKIPEAVFEMTWLESLNLRNNQLTTISSQITQMKNLKSLNLHKNQLATVPPQIAQMKNLQGLYLGDNGLTTIPSEIAQMKNLKDLDLCRNQLMTIPIEIAQLQNLQWLDLSFNQITIIPAWLVELPRLATLILHNNAVQTPPPEVLEISTSIPIDLNKLRSYFRQLDDEGDDTLYEAKLIIIGEAGAGKTTLVKKLQDPTYPVNPTEPSTEGIDVAEWHFDLDLSGFSELQVRKLTGMPAKFRVNLWDFGGQEIYHATHKFFLTRRSLYILVADAREQKTDFYYWLNVVELLSDNSPALIVSNEKQNRAWPFNENQLRGEFSSLKEAFPVNLADTDNHRLNQIIKAIKYHIMQLPHVGQTLPKTWVRVREVLEADPRDTMPLHEYLDLCERQGFKRDDDKLQLSDYLHDLGVCLHFQDDPLLNKTLILKPEWGTAVVYAVLEDKDVQANRGQFSRTDLKAIWHEEKYARWRDELLQLMLRFELCYPLPAPADAYIIPQLLSENRPEYPWKEENNLFLRYRYPAFMPKGILTRFIVATHRLIANQQWVWKTGVILTETDVRAEIIEHYQRREITIRVSGGQKRELLTKIAYEFEKIHADFPRLQFKQLIPCNCSNCTGNPKPYFFDFGRLKKRLAKGVTTPMECGESYEMVDVWGLIDNVGARQQAMASGGIQVGGDYIHIEGSISNVHGMGIGRKARGSSSHK